MLLPPHLIHRAKEIVKETAVMTADNSQKG